MNALAIGVYAAYLLVAFGARTLIQVRRTGDNGFRGLSGRPGSAAWWAGILFVVALVVGVAAPVAGALGLPPIGRLDHPMVNRIGIVVAITGVALTLVAQLQMGTAWRIGVDENERTDLVTTGIFRIVRNPIFTAMGITAVGLTLMVPNAIAVAGLLALGVALELQVRIVEEPYLRTLHGNVYVTYEARTGRFLPTRSTRRHGRQRRHRVVGYSPTAETRLMTVALLFDAPSAQDLPRRLTCRVASWCDDREETPIGKRSVRASCTSSPARTRTCERPWLRPAASAAQRPNRAQPGSPQRAS